MNDKTAINQRFTNAVNHLISETKAENKTTIADKIKISKSKFSEILNNRMSIGIEDLAKFCEVFCMDANWILTGKGEMKINTSQTFIKDEHKLKIAKPGEELLEAQKITIDNLQREVKT